MTAGPVLTERLDLLSKYPWDIFFPIGLVLSSRPVRQLLPMVTVQTGKLRSRGVSQHLSCLQVARLEFRPRKLAIV